MTLMTNDLNDHHDRMVVVEVFVYDKKKVKPDALSSARLFLTILTLATILSRVSRSILPKLIFPKTEIKSS